MTESFGEEEESPEEANIFEYRWRVFDTLTEFRNELNVGGGVSPHADDSDQ